MTIDAPALTAFVLALVRTTSWALTAPIIGTRGTAAATGRLALSLAVALFLAPQLVTDDIPTEVVPFGGAVVVQVLVGAGLGWVTTLVVSAFLASGSLIDFMSGFSTATVFDPTTGTPVSVFGRFVELLFAVLLFVTPAHRILLGGFVASFEAVPLSGALPFDEDFATVAASAVGELLLSALQIAAPVVGALFLTEVALGVAARFVPQANVFIVGLPLKVMVALFTIGGALVFFPGYLDRLVDRSVDLTGRFLT